MDMTENITYPYTRVVRSQIYFIKKYIKGEEIEAAL